MPGHSLTREIAKLQARCARHEKTLAEHIEQLRQLAADAELLGAGLAKALEQLEDLEKLRSTVRTLDARAFDQLGGHHDRLLALEALAKRPPRPGLAILE